MSFIHVRNETNVRVFILKPVLPLFRMKYHHCEARSIILSLDRLNLESGGKPPQLYCTERNRKPLKYDTAVGTKVVRTSTIFSMQYVGEAHSLYFYRSFRRCPARAVDGGLADDVRAQPGVRVPAHPGGGARRARPHCRGARLLIRFRILIPLLQT